MNYLGDKPSSRVLRPPGGGGSNIFGTDEPASENKATNPTSYQKSSVFSTEPLPDKSVTNRRSVDTASNIFGASSAYTVSPKKVSKTLQSSVFSEPEPVKPSNARFDAGIRYSSTAFKNGTHRMSNIPMFNSTGPPDPRRPVRRPVTAPPGQVPLNTVTHNKGACYATDVNPDAGQKTKIRTGNQIPAPQESNGEKKETGGTAEENKSEPHLGPIKSMSGVRCAQPPGGKSSISFG